jgi:hypothetical protein
MKLFWVIKVTMPTYTAPIPEIPSSTKLLVLAMRGKCRNAKYITPESIAIIIVSPKIINIELSVLTE